MAFTLDEYLIKSSKIKNLQDLFDHYTYAVNFLGFNYNVFIFFPPVVKADETVPICPHFNVSEEIIKTYFTDKLYLVGPIFEYAKTTGKPVIWSQFISNQKKLDKSPEVKKFVDLIKSYGFVDGLTIPIFGFSNSFGYFSFSDENKFIDKDDPKTVLIFQICYDVFRQYLRITELDKQTITPLTLREKEVLGWVLKGKSNTVIAEIMNISEHTVTTYIRRSAQKLGASGKWSSAVTAVLKGSIHY